MLWLLTIFSCAIAFVSAVWAFIQISNKHAIRLCNAIPSARPSYPLLGNTLLFACSQEKMSKNLLDIIKETVRKGHRAVCFWFGPYPLVFVTDPNDIRTILAKNLRRGRLEGSREEIFKNGIISLPVDEWKPRRRHLNLSLHHRNLEQLMPTFNLTSRRLVADLSGHVDGGVFNLLPHSMSAAIRTICTFVCGQETMELISNEQFSDLLHAVEISAELLAVRVIRPWLNSKTVFYLLYAKEIKKFNSAFQSFFRTANTNSKRRVTSKNKDTDGHTFQTILDAMQELQERDSTVTDQHIMEEIKGFFITGTDTIGVTVSSCLLALARYPHIQTRVYEEICAVLTEEDEDITHSHLKQLTYLERVIKETLRFFTIIPVTAREPNKDVDLGGYTLPANKLTIVCVTSVFLDPKYFPEPDKFDPDRFLQSDVLDDFFIPFSRGPRNCIGKAYSMIFIKVMVVHVIRKYRLSTNMDLQNLKRKIVTILTCCDGYNVSLTTRSE